MITRREVGRGWWARRVGRVAKGGRTEVGEVGIPLAYALRGGLRWPSVESMVEVATRGVEGERRG